MGCDGQGRGPDDRFDRSIKLKKLLAEIPLSEFTFGDLEALIRLRFGDVPTGTSIQLSDDEFERIATICQRFKNNQKGSAR